MHILLEQQRLEIVQWLRKQRDGIIIGEYRNILYNMYKAINDINVNTECICTLKKLTNDKSIYYKSEAQVLEVCNMLKELGYIDFSENSSDMKIITVKQIDF